MKTLVERFPELFVIEHNSFFYGGCSDRIIISPVIKAAIPNLEKAAKDYATKTIIDADINIEAFENCKNRFINGACWYVSNVLGLKALSDKELKQTYTIAKTIYSKDYCETTFSDDYTKEDTLILKESLEEDFGEGIKYGAFTSSK